MNQKQRYYHIYENVNGSKRTEDVLLTGMEMASVMAQNLNTNNKGSYSFEEVDVQEAKRLKKSIEKIQ